jgi:2-hydroxychromene-2-carboxylate isomerase
VSVQRVDFYFDFISPYAYFGWQVVPGVCARRGVPLRLQPILFAVILDKWGHKGPAEIPPKRTYLFSDVFRIGRSRGFPLVGPAKHPFNPLVALRLAMPEVGGADQARVIDAIFAMSWGQGGDPGDTAALVAALDAAGLDGAGLLARTQEPAVKEGLKARTGEAMARGTFGVPTMIAVHDDGREELFWGFDAVPWLEMHLDGRDPVDRDAVAKALERPAGATRPGSR